MRLPITSWWRDRRAQAPECIGVVGRGQDIDPGEWTERTFAAAHAGVVITEPPDCPDIRLAPTGIGKVGTSCQPYSGSSDASAWVTTTVSPNQALSVFRYSSRLPIAMH